jgi:hypothetical protein
MCINMNGNKLLLEEEINNCIEPCSWRGVLNTTLCDEVFSDLRQVDCFLWVLQFPPPIKLTATI